MNTHKALIALALLPAWSFGSAQAADEPPAEVTMTVIEEGESVDRVLAPIELPDFGMQEKPPADGKETVEEGAAQANEDVKDAVGRGALEEIPQNVRDNMPERIDEPNEEPFPEEPNQPPTNDPANGDSD